MDGSTSMTRARHCYVFNAAQAVANGSSVAAGWSEEVWTVQMCKYREDAPGDLYPVLEHDE